MTPAGLDHSDFRVGKKMDRRVKQLWLRNEIGVEDADEFAPAVSQTGLERARLVSRCGRFDE